MVEEETRTQKILSFDVGVRHLAYCVLQAPACLSSKSCTAAACQILDWDVLDLDKVSSVEACAEVLMRALEARFADKNFDLVLVERQPKARSILMVAVQMLLCGYFTLAKVRGSQRQRQQQVKFISATRKLAMAEDFLPESDEVCTPVCTPATAQKQTDPNLTRKQQKDKAARQRYAANKKYAVRTCRHYLEHVLVDFANLALLDQYPKKDDLCDALLQALSYVESGGRCSRILPPKRSNLTVTT